MPQCKRSFCNEPADPAARKRYCTAHWAEYEAKRRAWDKVQATLPDCVSCGGKVPKGLADEGGELCRDCAEERAQENREHERRQQFWQANTVEDLKQWLHTHGGLDV